MANLLKILNYTSCQLYSLLMLFCNKFDIMSPDNIFLESGLVNGVHWSRNSLAVVMSPA